MPPAKKDDKTDDKTQDGDAPATIDGLIAHYSDLVRSAVDDYAELAGNAAKRVAGGQGAPATSWADDITKFWGLVARDQAVSMKAYTQFLTLATTPPTKGK